jgi:hypothetical protein
MPEIIKAFCKMIFPEDFAGIDIEVFILFDKMINLFFQDLNLIS